MKCRRVIFGVMVLYGLSSVQVRAQENVAGAWASLSVNKNLGKGFSLALRGEYRCKDNFASDELYFFRLTGSYRICDYLSAAIAYDYFTSQQGSSTSDGLSIDSWKKHSHRALADLTGNYKTHGFTFSLRERYVYAYNLSSTVAARDDAGMYVSHETPSGTSHLFRSCPTVSYRIGESAFTPYISAEFYNSLNSGDRFKLQQWHLFAGTNIKLDKVNSLKVYYVMQTKNPSGKHIHCIGLDYTITLP